MWVVDHSVRDSHAGPEPHTFIMMLDMWAMHGPLWGLSLARGDRASHLHGAAAQHAVCL